MPSRMLCFVNYQVAPAHDHLCLHSVVIAGTVALPFIYRFYLASVSYARLHQQECKPGNTFYLLNAVYPLCNSICLLKDWHHFLGQKLRLPLRILLWFSPNMSPTSAEIM